MSDPLTVLDGMWRDIRSVTVEVSRYGADWKPEAYMCRCYPRDAAIRPGVGVAGNPRAATNKAVREALANIEKQVAADSAATTTPGKKTRRNLGV